MLNELKFNRIMREACEAAEAAAVQKLADMRKAGPQFKVYSADIFGGRTSPESEDSYMLDNCGGGWITIPGRGELISGIKKYGQPGRNARSYRGHILNWDADKSVYKGYSLHFRTSLMGRQEQGIPVAAHEAALAVLKSYGYKGYVRSYLS
jgi:hypothetical protein